MQEVLSLKKRNLNKHCYGGYSVRNRSEQTCTGCCDPSKHNCHQDNDNSTLFVVRKVIFVPWLHWSLPSFCCSLWQLKFPVVCRDGAEGRSQAGALCATAVRWTWRSSIWGVLAEFANVDANVDISAVSKVAFWESCVLIKRNFCNFHIMVQPNLPSPYKYKKTILKIYVCRRHFSTFCPCENLTGLISIYWPKLILCWDISLVCVCVYVLGAKTPYLLWVQDDPTAGT